MTTDDLKLLLRECRLLGQSCLSQSLLTRIDAALNEPNALPQVNLQAQPSREDCGPVGGAPTPETDGAIGVWTDKIVEQSRLIPADAFANLRDACRKLEREKNEARKLLRRYTRRT